MLALAAAPARGEEEQDTRPVAVVGRASLYQDDDHTTVITFLTDASGATGDLSLRAGVLADIQSSASVDVVTNATPGQPPSYSEPRTEFSASAGYRSDPVTLNAGYIFSTEHDYRSRTISVGSSVELLDRNSTLAIGYSLGLNEIWRALSHKGGADPFFAARDKKRQGFDLSWTQVLGRRTLGALSYSLALESGLLSSPYRFVGTSDGAFRARELHPGRRVRHAVGARVRRYVARDTAVEAIYRFYADDWGVVSHTAGATALWQPLRWLELEAHDRFYSQNDADFYQASYDVPQPLMSGDKELSRFWDNMIGVRAGVVLKTPLGPLDRLRLDAQLDWLHFEYSNFPLRPKLDALVTQLGIMGEF